jgi:hypothetical protein
MSSKAASAGVEDLVATDVAAYRGQPSGPIG